MGRGVATRLLFFWGPAPCVTGPGKEVMRWLVLLPLLRLSQPWASMHDRSPATLFFFLGLLLAPVVCCWYLRERAKDESRWACPSPVAVECQPGRDGRSRSERGTDGAWGCVSWLPWRKSRSPTWTNHRGQRRRLQFLTDDHIHQTAS
jgi:hypothetical protein